MFKGVYQFLPNMSYGDAISNYTLVIKDILKELGSATEIFSINTHQKLFGLTLRLSGV